LVALTFESRRDLGVILVDLLAGAIAILACPEAQFARDAYL
jgi:hypothetical protein